MTLDPDFDQINFSGIAAQLSTILRYRLPSSFTGQNGDIRHGSGSAYASTDTDRDGRASFALLAGCRLVPTTNSDLILS
jgi:hypothetical protein